MDKSEIFVYEFKWLKKIKNFILRRKEIEKDCSGNSKKFKYTLFIWFLDDDVTMPFELSMKDLFSDCDNKKMDDPKGPFSTNTRALLVDSILNDVIFCKIKNISKLEADSDYEQSNSPKGKKWTEIYIVFLYTYLGFEYLIKQKYFDDAFILHDEAIKSNNISKNSKFLTKE